MTYINSGDTITLSIAAKTSYGASPSSILDSVSLALQKDNLRVVSSQVQTSGFSESVTNLLTGSGNSFLATMKLQAQGDFNSDTDVADIVAHEIYVATGIFGAGGNYPQAVSVLSVNDVATGLGPAAPGPSGEPPSSSLSDIISGFFDKLQGAGTTLLVVVVGIIVLVLILAAYSPNTGHIARAATAAAVL
jgi:hypothetical protein